MNCCFCPRGIEAAAGVTAIETRLGAVTVKLAVPLIAPSVAVMLVEPCPTLVANPELTVATAVAEEVQLAVLVRF